MWKDNGYGFEDLFLVLFLMCDLGEVIKFFCVSFCFVRKERKIFIFIILMCELKDNIYLKYLV